MRRKYIKRISGAEPRRILNRDKRPLSRQQTLENHVKLKEIITRDDLYSMSYNNPDKVLEKCAKRLDVWFEYIGDDKWVILK